jgi:hypothetical protein
MSDLVNEIRFIGRLWGDFFRTMLTSPIFHNLSLHGRGGLGDYVPPCRPLLS